MYFIMHGVLVPETWQSKV